MESRHQSFLRSRLILIGVVAALIVIGAVWAFGPGRVQPAAPQATLAPAPNITFTPPPDLKDLARQFPRLEKILNNPQLDSVYKDFLVAYESGGAEAAELLARQRGLLTPDDQIRVTLVLDTEDSTVLVAELQNLGVIVRGTYKDLIDVGIPLELIVKTAESDDPGRLFDQITQLEHVINLQLPAPGKPNTRHPASTTLDVSFRGAAFWRRGISTPDWQPTELRQRFLAPLGLGMTSAERPANILAGFLQPPDPVISEGVKVIGADKWQAAGYTGQGMKIGILDQGFDGYRDLLGRELPFNVTAKSFVPGIDPDRTGISHGAAVAEVIHDVAPDAKLYLAYYDGGDVSMGNAVEWLLQQGVHIISHSAGGLAAPMDGTGRDAELVKLAADNGVLWINSAGNNGTQHYRAAYTDTNNDGVHEFAPDKTLLAFQADPGGTSQIVLTWNDWQSGGIQDLDLFVFDQDGTVVASSRNSRAGDRPPVEQIVYQFDDARTYYVTISGINVTQPISLNLFVHQTPLLELADPIGSLATPGDAREALTVGAVHWHDNQLEPFSSQGPTADGRVKPDLVGPDGVTNAVYAPQGFFGTSAATPHIAGAAALVWSAYPQATASEIRDFLINHAIDLEPNGPDNETGAGLLVLSDPPPLPTPIPPTPTTEPGAPTATPQPTATARTIVLATPNRPRPNAAASANNSGNWLGVLVIGLVLMIGVGVGFSVMRRARSAQPDRTTAAPALDRAACSYCGYRLRIDANFCPQCGRPTRHPPACSRCQAPLRPDAKFCGQCGAPQS
jgi:subtilisin family serine protease/RNA polymerase subunit RPABC4/transcription elongation factor Spt4